jgi:hypothetical protein
MSVWCFEMVGNYICHLMVSALCGHVEPLSPQGNEVAVRRSLASLHCGTYIHTFIHKNRTYLNDTYFNQVALQNISCGAQVYDSYGRKCNHRFLLNYGFSVENNIESDGFCPNEVRCCLSSICWLWLFVCMCVCMSRFLCYWS